MLLLFLSGWAGQVFAEKTAAPTRTPIPPRTIQGVFFALGDSILDGQDMPGGGQKFLDLFTAWLNGHYGPVTEMHDSAGLDSTGLSGRVESSLAGVTMSLCLLEIGMRNLYIDGNGGPDESRCGGCSLPAGLSSAFHFGTDLQNILSAIRSHLAPGGVILMANLYEADDSNNSNKDWKEYREILGDYNHIAAMAARVNGAKLIDLHALMAANPAYRDPGKLFPNSAGHAAIAALLEQAVEEAVPFPPGKKAPRGP